MNYSMLGRREVLRLAEPSSNLEVRLYELLEESDDPDDVFECNNCAELESQIDDKDHEVEVMKEDTEGLEEKIESLEKLLDDNEIDHNNIGVE